MKLKYNPQLNMIAPEEIEELGSESWLKSFVGMVATLFFIGILFLIAIIL